MSQHGRLLAAAMVAAGLAALAGHVIAQEQAAEPGRYHTEVVTDQDDYWVYTMDTTTGHVWFLESPGKWADEGAAPNGPGPVGKYQMAAFANKDGTHVYVTDTTTGELWLLNEEKAEWVPRGKPQP